MLGTGGYVSVPVALAAWMLGRPLLLQEQNSIPGLANRWLARIADEVHLSFVEARSLLRAQGPPQGHRQSGARLHPERRSRPRRCASSALAAGTPDRVHLRRQPRRAPHQRGGARRDAAAEGSRRRAVHPADRPRGLRVGARARSSSEQLPARVAAVPAPDPHGLRRRRPGGLPLGRDDAGRDRGVRHAGDPGAVPVRGARSPGGERHEPGRSRCGGDDPRPRADRRAAGAGDRALARRTARRLSRMSANARTFARPDAAERIVRSLERWSAGRKAVRADGLTSTSGSADVRTRPPHPLHRHRRHRHVAASPRCCSPWATRCRAATCKASEVTERLVSLGGRVFVGHAAANVEGAHVVVHSTAVRADNPEVERGARGRRSR